MSNHNDHKEWEREMPAEFATAMDSVRSQPVPQDSLERSLEAAESIGMTAAAMKRGYKNAVICSVLVYGTIALLALAFSRFLQWDFFWSVGAAFGTVWVVVYVAFIVNWLVTRQMSGAVLLDCGRHPTAKLFLLMPLVIIPVILLAEDWLSGVALGLFAVSFSSFWLIMSTGRLQIRENGIWQYHGLLRWEKLESYRWEGTEDATLMLQARRRFSFLGRGALPVAIEQKEAVDRLIQQKLEQTEVQHARD